MQKKEFSVEIGGKTLTATFSDLADQAHGSVILTLGNTSVLATAVISGNKREGIDFFPLVVDYEEKFYAAGAILGSRFMRREGRPSDEAILSGRAVDRTIRPLFDQRIRNEVQVIITVLSLDKEDPDILAINAASLALATSAIPWNGPASAVRIGMAKDSEEFVINPPREAEGFALDATVCGKDGNINMIEAGAHEVSEENMAKALARASLEIETLQKFQEKIVKEVGKEKLPIELKDPSDALKNLFAEHIAGKLKQAIFTEWKTSTLRKEWLALLAEKLPEEASFGDAYYEKQVDELVHREALLNGERADGRNFDEVRTLEAQAGGVSPVLHGTGIFYRGGTHVLSVLTLGGPRDAQLIEGMEIQGSKRFMHHYNFPPFSGGETGRMGGTNRRMIGHGALAEKALIPIIPPKESFPYTIRIVSESMASNGSTSMASVCASSIALMDAGVPITKPAAGIAMGLMLEQASSPSQTHADSTQKGAENTKYKTQNTKYKILTDIQGPEDHHGDMDFKVAGTRDGITAIQMDIKIGSIPVSILTEALEKAKKARLSILETIEKAIPAPRAELSPSAPRIIAKKIAVDKIGAVIGSGGATIRKITEATGADIEIEDDGSVYIFGKNGSAEKAAEMVEQIVHEYKPGERYDGEVTRLMDFGAFVRINEYAEGLVHISELAPVRIENVDDVVAVGDRVPVVVKEVDEKGRLNLSIKKADPDFFKNS